MDVQETQTALKRVGQLITELSPGSLPDLEKKIAALGLLRLCVDADVLKDPTPDIEFFQRGGI